MAHDTVKTFFETAAPSSIGPRTLFESFQTLARTALSVKLNRLTHTAGVLRILGFEDQLGRKNIFSLSESGNAIYENNELSLNEALVLAAENGNELSARLCLAWGASDVNKALVVAAENGHELIVNLCAKRGATDFDLALLCAAEEGHQSTTRRCLKLGATKINRALVRAVEFGHVDLALQFLYNWRATNLDEVLIVAAGEGHVEIARECLKLGAVKTEDALKIATANAHKDVQKLCQTWIDGFDSTDSEYYR